jgi:phosphoenolpyruvate carboxylase
MTDLPQELRRLVHESVAALGEVVKREIGEGGYDKIERLRQSMAEMRGDSSLAAGLRLEKHLKELRLQTPVQQMQTARAYILMLELINACENAYRSHRISVKTEKAILREHGEDVVFVLTAHPTEARSPHNIEVFHEIQSLLIRSLKTPESEKLKHELMHWLEVAWRTSVVRSRSPKVKDEAEHIYSLLFRDEVLFTLMDADQASVPFHIRSWVGGDKDGHPGVNEKTLLESLTLSRGYLTASLHREMQLVRKTCHLFSAQRFAGLRRHFTETEKYLRRLKTITANDFRRVTQFKSAFAEFLEDYKDCLGEFHPNLLRMRKLLETFPALVVPLELRESSDILMSSDIPRPKLAIYKMLKMVEKISRGGDAKGYARGFIISMTESVEHIRTACDFQGDVFGGVPIPVIPLFEEASSLEDSENIMTALLADKQIVRIAKDSWYSQIEMMVGYSDSSKESGVLASRVAIADTLPKLEAVCEKAGLTPVFFHGSGGSVDRGGGSVEDQTAWWPKSALRRYKVTIQGEMIERTLATPEIARRQIETIAESVAAGLKRTPPYRADPAVSSFADMIAEKYKATVTSKDFLSVVDLATPYSYLKYLKIGSRPAKRSKEFTVKGLRAIPWVLCWTQTRILFPTWWGVGSAWKSRSAAEKAMLKLAFKNDAVFTSFVKALGFTLAKIQIEIWKLYINESSLSEVLRARTIFEFENELKLTRECFYDLTGQKNPLWFRPWLGESIALRSSMIHPLNLLQIIATQTQEIALLRATVTGISSGMLTTG